MRLGQGHLQAGTAARLLQFERRPLGDDLAVVDDHDVMGQLVGLLQVLRRQQNGDALSQQLADGLPDPQAARRVQPRRRLVEEEHRRAGHQRPGQVQPSPHAAGVTLHHPVGRVGQLELGQEFLGPGPGGRPAQVGQLADEHQVLAPGQQRVQRRVLGGDADVAPHLARVAQHVDARHRGRSRIGAGQRGQDPHAGCLAGTVRAQEAEDGAGGDGKVHPGQGLGGAVAFGQSFRLDHEFGSHRHPYRSLSKLVSTGIVSRILTCRQVEMQATTKVQGEMKVVDQVTSWSQK